MKTFHNSSRHQVQRGYDTAISTAEHSTKNATDKKRLDGTYNPKQELFRLWEGWLFFPFFFFSFSFFLTKQVVG
jgi:hypothetical protein